MFRKNKIDFPDWSYFRFCSSRNIWLMGFSWTCMAWIHYTRVGMLSRSLLLSTRRSLTRRFSIRPGEDRPELDFDYLLDPVNLQSIRSNVKNRKQVGDIDRVHELWNRLGTILIDRDPSTRSASVKPTELKSTWDEFYDACFAIPNRSHPNAPVGDESNARLVEANGMKPRMDDFKPLLAENIAYMLRGIRYATRDVCTMAGDKAYFLFDNVSLLEKALLNYSLSIVQKRHKFELIYVPDVLNVRVPKKCGLSSRTEMNIVYTVRGNPDHCLSGTGEMGIASYLENRTFEREDTLPKRFVTVSRCYRPEVAKNRIEGGLYRVHEFTKVEMFAITIDDEDESEKMLDEFVQIQKEILDGLKLHYRVMDMPTRELGAPAYRKFDVEAWMPGRNVYGEISSASNCTDYQSRRLCTKYKTDSGDTRFVHTINGTACAASRLLIAFMEQHQQKNKLVLIPDALKPFFNDWPALYPSRKQLKIVPIYPRTFQTRDDNDDDDKETQAR